MGKHKNLKQFNIALFPDGSINQLDSSFSSYQESKLLPSKNAEFKKARNMSRKKILSKFKISESIFGKI